jgi:hypothetical protein
MIKLKDGSMVPSMMINMGMGGPSSSNAGNSMLAGTAGNANRRNLL